KIGAYPLPPRRVALGHIERGAMRYQILDTPGILDRPMAERNKMERQAIAALTHVADGVVFLLDPSESCGYPLDAQRRLLDEVQALFSSVPIAVVEASADLVATPSNYPRESVLPGEGVSEVLQRRLAEVTGR